MKLTPALLIALLALPLVHGATTLPADEALSHLKAGNLRFAGSPETSIPTESARLGSTTSQKPIAVVVTCSDSRTAPEFILNKNLNKIFVVRTAGNVVDNVGLGSIEYAVNNLGVRLIVVMGHENCGAVSAALKGGVVPAHIDSIVKLIAPAVKATSSSAPDQRLNDCIASNARIMAEKITKQGRFGDNATQVKVVPAVYNFQTGKVDWLGN